MEFFKREHSQVKTFLFYKYFSEIIKIYSFIKHIYKYMKVVDMIFFREMYNSNNKMNLLVTNKQTKKH